MSRFFHRYGEVFVTGSIFFVSLILIVTVNLHIRISPLRDSGESVGPQFWPVLLLVLLCVLSAVTFVKAIKKKQQEKVDEQEETEYIQQFTNARLLGIVAAIFFYLLLLPYLGFIVMTAVFTVVCGVIMKMKLVKNIAFALISLVFLTYVFGNFLTIPLPRGVGVLREASYFFY
ncbi:tripartite tricarboxylate transporter TctB family protein [Alkalihalobacillus oceani]|uniref:tripartite tricarboxylate transporter TctB family protein n=1 Tax=Halalkalibacter oceani TaxID=1653776 RepID=UPI002040987E|nr:tripartite tricarboxylate transporter TctB family protein [Halalkalibacter oceani]MCM3760114.1 tripartite tricarboxylate transporter TctB family protein [Halalkalibacter oceani]